MNHDEASMPDKKSPLKHRNPPGDGIYLTDPRLRKLLAAGVVPVVRRVNRSMAPGRYADLTKHPNAWTIELEVDGQPRKVCSQRNHVREWTDLTRVETQMRLWGFRHWRVHNEVDSIQQALKDELDVIRAPIRARAAARKAEREAEKAKPRGKSKKP
ncbi:hypothetical protein [Acidihalobacter aeolianus]|uniref:hypothetical protein n=1 Tax=Acidihalobacter aeolianus TaxID=2792603 RepID=UPI0012EA11A2|nr:hypothetical protein [Acidihalobacter aeolianus]